MPTRGAGGIHPRRCGEQHDDSQRQRSKRPLEGSGTASGLNDIAALLHERHDIGGPRRRAGQAGADQHRHASRRRASHPFG